MKALGFVLATVSDVDTSRTSVLFVFVRSGCGVFLGVSEGVFHFCIPLPLSPPGLKVLVKSRRSAPQLPLVG